MKLADDGCGRTDRAGDSVGYPTDSELSEIKSAMVEISKPEVSRGEKHGGIYSESFTAQVDREGDINKFDVR